MRVYVIEGTPDEIREAIPGLAATIDGQFKAAVASVGVDSGHAPVELEKDKSEYKEQAYVSLEVARAVLTRRKLIESQKSMLRAIYKTHPKYISAIELQEFLSLTPAQFRGFMGAWGRRYTHTEGFIEGQWFFEQEWDDQQVCFLYRLPESVRNAMDLENIA